MRAILASLAVLLAPPGAAAGAPPAAAAEPYTIHVSGGQVTRIGPFRPRRDPTIGAAVRAFGEPTSRRASSDSSCLVR